MKPRIIKTKKEYLPSLNWVDDMFDNKVKPDSKDGEDLQVMLILIQVYEDKNFPIPVLDPIEAIKLKMEAKGLKNKDLVNKVGS